MINIHLTLTDFRHESRLLKEVSSLNQMQIFSDFLVVALCSKGLEEVEHINSNVKVRRLNLWTRRLPKGAPFQILKLLEYMLLCFIIILRHKNSVINVHTLALLPLGVVCKWLLGSKLVYDAHELETEKDGLVGISQKVSKLVERFFIGMCDLVIVVGDYIADWYAEEYNIERPLVIKNAPLRKIKKKSNLFRETLGIREEQKILLYQGGLSRGRGVHLVVDSFKSRKDDSVVAVFMGYGDLEGLVRDAQEQYNNIFYLPAVSPDVVLDYTTSADVGIHMIQNTCLNHYYCMPNKFFEYSMAGLPILVSNMKEMAETVTKYGFGSVINEPTIESINKSIDDLFFQDIDKKSSAAYQFASANAWEVQQDIMLKGYRRMLKL